ncbi:N-acetyltransferase [Planctobacterium marinum]|uniref:N-acetyltransferase n=1 Tax=Planctobacterium marinum TaxID=1631968 RepID=UPI001E2FB418|nr:acyltransferase [Planctobacterium marinum]MCC2606216.1 N-acetyltransferase [Planctobacterium marinum]
MTYQTHESAIVDKGAVIGSGTKIWHWTHICSTAKIGKNCSLGQNVYIGPNVVIGNNVKIQNNVSVYEGVILEDDVFCGPSMVFTNVYNPRSAVNRKEQFRKTIVRQGASLGANCTIVCGNEVGSYAFVGAGSVINESVPDFALVVGVPGKQIGWMSTWGEKLDLPLVGEKEVKCPFTGEYYRLINNEVFRV